MPIIPSPAADRFRSFLLLGRQTNDKALKSALLIAALLAVLLYETYWPSLRTGLVILLCGQLVSAAWRVWRNAKLKQEPIDIGKPDLARQTVDAWFEAERSFARNLSRIENGARLIGFLVLGCGFWIATHILWIAVLLGVIYPVSVYAGITRRADRRYVARLAAQKAEMETLLAGH